VVLPLPPVTPLSWPEQPGDLPRDLPDRNALDQLLANEFPSAQGPLSGIQGGRQAAESQLRRVDAKRYGRSRNHLKGAVTRLSPWIRHGVLTLAEIREAVFAQLRDRGQGSEDGGKLINELGWRDFWQRMWGDLGDGIHESQEELKTGHDPASYSRELPDDVREGRTGLACMDGFSEELVSSGWLHNPASNHLSWQWVASSFSHKPYVFNRGNLERYSDGKYCKSCPSADTCPFEGSYDQLESQLFAPQPAIRDVPSRGRNSNSRGSASAAFARPKR
jgi:deoxyribodipyrimidine photo-lyase